MLPPPPPPPWLPVRFTRDEEASMTGETPSSNPARAAGAGAGAGLADARTVVEAMSAERARYKERGSMVSMTRGLCGGVFIGRVW